MAEPELFLGRPASWSSACPQYFLYWIIFICHYILIFFILNFYAQNTISQFSVFLHEIIVCKWIHVSRIVVIFAILPFSIYFFVLFYVFLAFYNSKYLIFFLFNSLLNKCFYNCSFYNSFKLLLEYYGKHMFFSKLFWKLFFMFLPNLVLRFLSFAQLLTIVENFVDNLENAAIPALGGFYYLIFIEWKTIFLPVKNFKFWKVLKIMKLIIAVIYSIILLRILMMFYRVFIIIKYITFNIL